MAKIGRVFTVLALTVLAFAGCGNVQTPAGYVGYVTQGAILGRSRFYALQTGPTSSGLGWLLHVVNVSVTPYTNLRVSLPRPPAVEGRRRAGEGPRRALHHDRAGQ